MKKLLSLRLKAGAIRLSKELLSEIATELDNLFNEPIKEFVRIWQKEKAQEGKPLSPDDILACYEICKKRCKPRYTIILKDKKAEKTVEVDGLEELSLYLDSYKDKDINHLIITMGIESYNVSLNFSNTPFAPSYVSIYSKDEDWLQRSRHLIERILSRLRCRNHWVNNIITIACTTCVVFVCMSSTLALLADKKYQLLVMILLIGVCYFIFWGVVLLCKYFFPLLRVKK